MCDLSNAREPTQSQEADFSIPDPLLLQKTFITTTTYLAESALISAHQKFLSLGKYGLEEINKNQFGETALLMDIEAEYAVIAVLRASGLPIRVISEEHGTLDLVKEPTMLAMLDGIDGTAEYKKDRLNGKFGTLLGLYSGLEPSYNDYLYGGIMLHNERKLYSASKDLGASIQVVVEGDTVSSVPVKLSAEIDLEQATIYVDEYFEINKRIFSVPFAEFNPQYTQSSTRYYTALAAGSAELVCECTRKGNLELAAAYPIINEAGGFLMTLNGESIGSKSFAHFGQGANEHIPVLSASNTIIARKALAKLVGSNL